MEKAFLKMEKALIRKKEACLVRRASFFLS